jgi:hypothetical protein
MTDCCDKFWRGTVSFEGAQQEVVIGRVVGFDEINEANVRGEVMVLPRIEECFQGEESVPTNKFRGATKLESGAMFVK